jgi:hypothetical protein
MPNIRRKSIAARAPLTPQMRRYLESGDYCGPEDEPGDFDTFKLAGQVGRGNVAGLAAAWAQHGPEILASWPPRARKRPWAEMKLGRLADTPPHRNGGPR